VQICISNPILTPSCHQKKSFCVLNSRREIISFCSAFPLDRSNQRTQFYIHVLPFLILVAIISKKMKILLLFPLFLNIFCLLSSSSHLSFLLAFLALFICFNSARPNVIKFKNITSDVRLHHFPLLSYLDSHCASKLPNRQLGLEHLPHLQLRL
jgi:hypothetical protein